MSPEVDPAAPPEMIKIDVISDFVCPWCWIGKRGLDSWLANNPTAARIWHPYFLHPSLPPEGMDRRDLMRIKFGPDGVRSDVVDAIAEAGERVGLSINYNLVERVPNTLDAHRLSRWAQGQGRGDAAAEALFAAYFEHGRDIGSAFVLQEIAADVGLDPDLVRELLESGADKEIVTAETEDLRDRGIPGVPTHLVGRKKMLVGAQDPGAFDQALAAL